MSSTQRTFKIHHAALTRRAPGCEGFCAFDEGLLNAATLADSAPAQVGGINKGER